MYLIFNVEQQTLTRTDAQIVASGSEGYLKAQFNLSDDWSGLSKKAQFKSTSVAGIHERDIVNEECEVPSQVLNKRGQMFVSVRGYDETNNNGPKPTTTIIKIPIVDGATQTVSLGTDVDGGTFTEGSISTFDGGVF